MTLAMKEPVYVFSIPPSVSETIQIRPTPRLASRPAANTSHPPTIEQGITQSTPQPEQSTSSSSSLSCLSCPGTLFHGVSEQREHYRSDWHRYNVKSRSSNPSAVSVTEAEFNILLERLDESLSGSASSSEEESDDDAVDALVSKMKRAGTHETSDSDTEPTKTRSPIVWLHSPRIADTQFGIYTAILDSPNNPEIYANPIHLMQDGGDSGRFWALFMTAGGHFAGMIVRVSNPGFPREVADDSNASLSGKKKPSKKGHHRQADFEIIAHKTFHRYTTRRKQGGSQSVNDNAKGPAKSAGAQLRRYGEQSLRDDIRALLQDWTDELDICDRIFIRASVSNRRIFLDGENSPIQKGDNRLRTFPFPTRRPTQSELVRCLTELTRAKITHLTEEELRRADEEYLASVRAKQRPKVVPASQQESLQKQKPQKEVLSPEELAVREKWRRLLDMVQKGRMEPLQKFWNTLVSIGGAGVLETEDSAVNTRIPKWLREEEGKRCGSTLLQVAAASGQDEVVQWLLLDLRADPTIDVPSTVVKDADAESDSGSDGERTTTASHKAYNIARSRAVRNVFRRTAYIHPDWWDWLSNGPHGAGLPSALDPEKEAADHRKKAVRKKGLKERMKEREQVAAAKAAEEKERLEREEVERLRKEAEAAAVKAANRTGPQRLGGGPIGGGNTGNTGLASMTPELRARIERERRARAAEARLRTTNGS